MSRRLRLLTVLVLAVVVFAAGCRGDDSSVTAVGSASGAPGQEGSPDDAAEVTSTPIGGGAAAGTGADVELVCPRGIEQKTEEWFGPVGLTQRDAVAEAFGDLVVGWMGTPFEIQTTDTWSSWGLANGTGDLVAVATVVVTEGGWDPSHARYCDIPPPSPPPAPFTLYVSNQSFEDPTVRITVSIDGEVVVDQDFEVEGQHNWIAFEPDVAPGHHVLRATSSTGAEMTVELTIPEGEPRWTVLSYWFYPDDGPREFTFQISDEPVAFA